MSSTIVKLHRGLASVMADAKKNIVLASGELFIEIPDSITDDNQYKFKVGDGTTTYQNLKYAIIDKNLVLGETETTAYRGDRGKIAYEHSQSTHARTDATKVEASGNNGKIKINGSEVTVYTHPSGTNPHGTTASDVGLGNVGNFKAVSTVASQGLTATEKSNAIANIGAATSGHTHDLSIATDSGSAAISLAANTTYKLTAGGKTYIFKTPADNNSDTKNTAGSTDTSSKIFLIGATSQAANPQTYSDNEVYATSGTLTAKYLSPTAGIKALTGSGTAGSDAGSGNSPRYKPSLWTFNAGVTVANGEVYFIKIPVAGGTYGVWLSLNNGTNYYPVTTSNGKARFTTHYPANTVIAVTYESASACTCYAKAGADSTADVTGCFRVLNDYDANTNTAVTQTATSTNANYEVLFSATADNTTRTEGARKYNNLTFNPSTGNLNVTKINSVTVGSSPKFTDTTYSAGTGLSLSSTTFSLATSGATAGSYGPSANVTGSNNATMSVPYITVDSYGRITAISNKTYTAKNDNTTYTPQKLGFGYGTCATAAATAAKAVTLADYILEKNGIVSVKFTYDVPANATLNVNSKGAKNIYYNGAKITAGIINAGDLATFIYDGTQYHLIANDSMDFGLET